MRPLLPSYCDGAWLRQMMPGWDAALATGLAGRRTLLRQEQCSAVLTLA